MIGFEKLGAAEYLYCALLVVYAGLCWYSLHDINKNTSGIESLASLIWSFVSQGSSFFPQSSFTI